MKVKLVYDIGTITDQWRKDELLKIWCSHKSSIKHKTKLGSFLILPPINSKWIKGLNMKKL